MTSERTPVSSTSERTRTIDSVMYRVIGGYKPTALLGTGSTSRVFRATRESDGIDVAFKVLPLKRRRDPVAVGRFEREARLARSLDHPNLVRMYDAGIDGDIYYMAMELVEGLTLTQLLKQTEGLLTPADVLRWHAEALDGLSHAHDHDIVHRDIKPDNIMVVDGAGTAKLLDFGLGREITSSHQLTSEGRLVGTPNYLAPEVIEGKPASVVSDVFSLGVSLYRCLTGRLPFSGPNITRVLMSVFACEYPPPTQVVPTLPKVLDELVARFMQKDASARFTSAAEARDALLATKL